MSKHSVEAFNLDLIKNSLYFVSLYNFVLVLQLIPLASETKLIDLSGGLSFTTVLFLTKPQRGYLFNMHKYETKNESA